MNNFIVNQIPTATLQAIKQAVANQITAANQYKVGLSDAEKSGLRTMAFGREGFARTVNKIAQTETRKLAKLHEIIQAKVIMILIIRSTSMIRMMIIVKAILSGRKNHFWMIFLISSVR